MSPTPLPTNPSAYALVPAGKFYETRRNGKCLGVVLHVTAGLQDLGMVGTDESMEGTIKWALNARPEVSWHAGVDSDGVELCLPDWYTGWHAKGYNSRTVGIEISNLDAKWGNKPAAWTTATLRNTAKVAAAYAKKYGLPLTLASKAQVDAAIAANKPFGFTYHAYTSPLTRTDPGKDFPWAQFIGYVKAELAPPKPPAPVFKVGPTLSRGDDGPKVRVLQVGLNRLVKAGLALDSSFGPKTESATKRYQTMRKLTPDGRVGPKTQQWLFRDGVRLY